MNLHSAAAAKYDEHLEFYVGVVDQQLADPHGFWHAARAQFDRRLAGRLAGLTVLDVACGEGHLSRHLHRHQPAQIIGVDISRKLLDVARERSGGLNITFQHDDAQQLKTVDDTSVDVAVSFLALMDIPDHQALFTAIRRVLKPGGTLMFSTLHPCFEAPFFDPECPQFLVSEAGKSGYIIRRYGTEGYWQSGKNGVRGRVGSYHRTLSTLINDLLRAGFAIRDISEPRTPGDGLFAEIPRVMVIEVEAV